MDPTLEFETLVSQNIEGLKGDDVFRKRSLDWLRDSHPHRYSYNFRWLGRPIIQYPQDIVATQELIWHIKPDLIIETGIAHGGSLILSASMLALLDYCDAVDANALLDPKSPRRRVLGVDIDIRSHNRAAIESHPMANRIDMIQGSSVSPAVIDRVRAAARGRASVMIILDSNHTHDHVLAELNAYASLVTSNSYCVVFDTVIQDMPAGSFPERPWDVGNNPKTAVQEFLVDNRNFEVDEDIEAKLGITVAPGGYLRRI
ncbi:MAG: cephalosporin hydroxylase family protein [Dokdonella sp.]|uniref:cephalosporin hydroxylase family protein n=1 Tax=Dokdonella sp. TaxID=2291710 RepID=UPI003266493F